MEIEKELNDRVGMARDYGNIGSTFSNIGNNQEALEYHNKALAIHTGLNDRIGMAVDYARIGRMLKLLDKNDEAIESIDKGLNILVDLENDTGYQHPLIETLKDLKKDLSWKA